jgi:hypothetical protein
MAGHKFSTGIDLQGKRAQNAALATADTDLATLGQLKAYVNGLDWHLHARVASKTNVTVSAPGASIDGVAMNAGDRVLLTAQTTGSENLIYVYQGSAVAMTIAADSANGVLGSDATLGIAEGTSADKSYTLVTDGVITVGTTSLTWGLNNAAVAYTNGYGLTLTGNQFAVDGTKIAGTFKQTIGDGSAVAYTLTHNLPAGADVQVQVYILSTGEVLDVDVSGRTTTAVTLTFGTAPAANSMRAVIIG